VCRQAPSVPRTDAQRASHHTDPAPLTPGQLWALIGATLRELIWGLRAVASELRTWHAYADRIPDASIRHDALEALERKRGNTDGAALFWIIPRKRNADLLKLLVTYQVMWDFLDNVSETAASAGYENGRRLHLALVDAVDPTRRISDYYSHNPVKEDGGYLCSLVEVCRTCMVKLPSFERIHPLLLREARRANVQAINHDPQPDRRAVALRAWAKREWPRGSEVSWFELSAAAGAGISIYALFALATECEVTQGQMQEVYNAYFPWASALATMLDSYVDGTQDAAHGDHVYVNHYGSAVNAQASMQTLMRESLLRARRLARGESHSVVVACMVAMYLSKDSALTSSTRGTTGELLSAGGSLSKLLLPALRLWRIAYRQRTC
jgi:tetraprenyl-beta-curcumene synthase